MPLLPEGAAKPKTEMAAIKGLWFAIMNENVTVLIVSPTQRASSILFRRMKTFLAKSAFERGELKLINTIVRETQSVLEFDNGSQIYSLPASNKGDNLRGFTSDFIIIDEGGQIDDEVWGIIRPMLITRKGVLMVIGTPNGCNNMFYKFFTEDKYMFTKYHFKTKINPLADEKQMKVDQESMSEIEYRQEYLGEFVDTADMLFKLVDVEACMIRDNYRNAPEPVYEYFLGYDPATVGQDEASACILEYRPKLDPTIDSQPYSIAKIVTFKGKSIPEQIEIIEHLQKSWNFTNIAVDITGMGQGLVKEKLFENRVKLSDTIVADGVSFTIKTKQDIFFNLKRLIEAGQIILGKNDKLKKQLVELKGERKPDTITRISHPRHGNDDLATALALSVWAAKKQNAVIIIGRIKSVFQ